MVINAGEPFVKGTYDLEEDGALAFKCYEIYTSLLTAVELQHYPNLCAIAKKLSGSVRSLLDRFMNYEKDSVIQYLNLSFQMSCLLVYQFLKQLESLLHLK